MQNGVTYVNFTNAPHSNQYIVHAIRTIGFRRLEGRENGSRRLPIVLPICECKSGAERGFHTSFVLNLKSEPCDTHIKADDGGCERRDGRVARRSSMPMPAQCHKPSSTCFGWRCSFERMLNFCEGRWQAETPQWDTPRSAFRKKFADPQGTALGLKDQQHVLRSPEVQRTFYMASSSDERVSFLWSAGVCLLIRLGKNAATSVLRL